MARSAESCPACLSADNGRFFNQTLMAVAFMWLLPVLLASAIGLKIYFLCKGSLDRDEKSGA
ncbi:MAG: hypothetical protein KBD53_06495 [Candidatus Omnitrophica bacterium]|nr:hypothetical protein [Candidatus Omnitrophota bacterium]